MRTALTAILAPNFEMSVELEKSTFEAPDEELPDGIPTVSDISYSEFFEKYLVKNRPCVIKNVASNWESTQKWVVNNLPNFVYLSATYGDTCISVQDCGTISDYHNAKSNKWKYCDYLKYWQDYIDKKYPKEMPVYYLKDWHLKNQCPNDHFYEVPVYFASDWLNEYLADNLKDDYRFVYMGVKGTWSPFHVDVMTSYSWSCNISGQKRWILLPPGEEKYLCDRFGNFPPDISNLLQGRKFFEVIQCAGDAIFVPSNWHHQVWNLKDTISINHNWINGCNLKNTWHTMEKNLAEVKNEIQDCKDMEDFLQHCQVMLRASFSMDFEQFYNFISHIALKRINLLQAGTPVKLAENRTLGHNHALFDLQSIKDTLSLFCQHDDLENLNIKNTPCNLLETIEGILEKSNKS